MFYVVVVEITQSKLIESMKISLSHTYISESICLSICKKINNSTKNRYKSQTYNTLQTVTHKKKEEKIRGKNKSLVWSVNNIINFSSIYLHEKCILCIWNSKNHHIPPMHKRNYTLCLIQLSNFDIIIQRKHYFVKNHVITYNNLKVNLCFRTSSDHTRWIQIFSFGLLKRIMKKV